jgi:hypothetical protein
MKRSLVLVGAWLGVMAACTAPDAELVGAGCTPSDPTPCGTSGALVCNPGTLRCELATPTDAGATDAGVDAGTTDAGTTDAGTTDAGTTDAGTTDAGTTDAGTTDAGTTDAGTTDAGTTDAGTTDAGTTDAGTTDAGTTDAGVDAGTRTCAPTFRQGAAPSSATSLLCAAATVDPDAGADNSVAYGVATFGKNVWVAGAVGTTPRTAVVRLSTDNGVTWETFFTHQGIDSYATHITVDGCGNAFLAVNDVGAGNGTVWRALAGETTFTKLQVAFSNGIADVVVPTGDGRLVALGYTGTGSASVSSVAYESLDLGDSWTQVDSTLGRVTNGGFGTPTGDVWNVGYVQNYRWYARSSAGGTGTPDAGWADSEVLTTSTTAARAGASTSDGTLFVCGDDFSPSKWITRRSTNHGASWAPVDTIDASATGGRGMPAAIGVLPNGVLVGGNNCIGSGCAVPNWFIRGSLDGVNWITVDYFGNAGKLSNVSDLASDSDGNAWAVGVVNDGNNIPRWTVRKLTCTAQ